MYLFVLATVLFTVGVGQMWGWETYQLRGDHPGWDATAWTFSHGTTTTLYMANNDGFKLYHPDWGDNSWMGAGTNFNTKENGDNGHTFYQKGADTKYIGPSGMVCFHMDQSGDNKTYQPWVWITRPTWYLKHNWNNGSWTWKAMTDNEDGTYYVDAQYGGQTTVNHGDNGSDGGSGWGSITATTYGSPSTGNNCRFKFDASNSTVTITKLVTITFDGNGKTSGSVPSNQEVLYNTSSTLATNSGSLAKTDYVFTGWNTKADGSGQHYDAGGSITITADTKLYAEWNRKWAIQGSGTEMGTWSAYNYLDPTATANEFSGTITLAANTTYVFKIRDRQTNDLWGYGDKDYQLAYIGQASAFDHDLETTAGKKDLVLMTAKAGTYTFTWNSSSKRLTVGFPSQTHPNSNNIYFKNSGGSSYSGVCVHIWGGTEGGTTGWNRLPSMPTCTIFGDTYYYAAIGDNSKCIFANAANTGTNTGDLTSIDTKKGQYYDLSSSTWKDFTVSVSLDNQSATTAGASSVTATYGSAMPSIASNLPEKDGYTFGGYFASAGGSGTQYYNSDGTSAHAWDQTGASPTLYAKWTAETYDITLNKNGGATDGSATATYDSGTLTGFTAATKTGYNCSGYYTADDGGEMIINASGVLQSNKSGYTDASGNWTRNEDTELYAHWTAATYRITFDNQGADDSGTLSKDVVYDDAAQFNNYQIIMPSKSDDSFGGYFTETNGGGTQLINRYTGAFMNAEGYLDENSRWVWADDLTLYAYWVASGGITGNSATNGTYTVQVGSRPSITAPVDTIADAGETITLTATPNTGYSFTSWTVIGATPASSTSATTTFTMPDDEVTISATFSAKTYTVTLDLNGGSGDGSVIATYKSVLPSFTLATWAGYTLDGYFTSGGTKVINADGTLVASVDGYTNSYGQWTKDGGETLYAQWTRTNVALNKTAVAGWSRRGSCSEKNDGEIPDKAVDGNTSTQWVAYGIKSLDERAFWKAWLAVDLGAVYSLSDFSTVWRSDGGWGTAPSKYIIQVAESKTDAPADFADDVERENGWLTVAEVNETQTLGGNENNYAFDSYPVHARYVRIAAMDNDNVEMALSEFRLFSDGSDTEVTPTMGTASVYSDLSAGSATLTLTGTDHSGGRLNTFLLQDQGGNNYRAVTDGNNRCTITGLDSKRYIFKVWATENGYVSETYATVIVGASSELDPTENLALNKPVHASSYSGTDEPYKANDGSLDNYWVDGVGYSGSKRDSVWWYVDLQDNYALKSVALFWEGAYATHFIMQVRKNTPYSSDEYDDDAWETFLDYTGDQTEGTTESDVNNYGDTTGAKAAFSILPKGRYVRIRMLDAKNWSWGIKLREVRVFGYGYLPADDEAPVIRTASKNSETLDKTGVIFDVEADDDSRYPVKSYIVKDYTGAKHYVRDESAAGQIIVTGLPTGKDESVSIYAVDSAGNISYPYVVGPFDYVNPTENLALNKTAYAVTEWQASEGIDKANDGSTSTYWTSYGSASHTNDWWYVDLGDFYDISRIEVVWMSGYNSTSYSVQYRQNAPKVDGGTSSEWDAISEFTNVTTGDKSADIASSVSAQYICLRSASNGGDQVRLAEVRVFGSAFGTPDEDEPEWSVHLIEEAENNRIAMRLAASDAVDGDIYDFVININNGTTDKDYERTTTALSNEITITDASMIQPCTTYTITAKCYDHVGNEATKVFEDVTTSISDDYNLALSKTTAAGISEGGDNGQNAVDGNKENQWSGNAAGMVEDGVNQWMYVDLGQNYNIDSIWIMWGNQEGSWPRDYELQVSYNGTEYRTIVHKDTKDAYRTVSYADLDAKGRYVRVWANTSGTSYGMCITELEVYGACYTEETTYWFMGQGATSTAWSTPANWFGNVMPNIDDDVVLLAPAEVDVTYAQAKSVVIDQSGSNTGSLTIPAGKALVVAGTVKKTTDGSTLSATAAEDITIGSDVTSGNGALVIGDEDGTTKATVQFYTKAGMRDGEWVNQYIGTPFSDETYIKNNYYGMQIYAFSASSGEWVTPRMADDADMTPFVGYDLLSKGYTAGSHTLNMTGTLNASSSDKVMSLTNDKDEAKENMLANSWVAPIVIGEFTGDDFVNADPTIYIFNAGSPEDYDNPSANTGSIENAGTSSTGAGQYTSIPINLSPFVEGYHTIPSMQAFSVMTTKTSSAASLKLNYKQLVYDPAVDGGITMEKNHAKRRAAAEGKTPEIVKLYVRGESGYKDMLWMLVREDFTEGFDGGWDGRKMFGYEEAPQLYAQSEAGELSVGAVSDIEGTVLGFKAGILDDEYTFTFEYDGDEVLYLKDLYKNKYALVRTGEIYTFNDNDIGSHNRFVLTRHNSPQIATDVEPTPDPSMKGREKAVKLIIDDQMYILYRGVMYDATGKRVEERRAE